MVNHGSWLHTYMHTGTYRAEVIQDVTPVKLQIRSDASPHVRPQALPHLPGKMPDLEGSSEAQQEAVKIISIGFVVLYPSAAEQARFLSEVLC